MFLSAHVANQVFDFGALKPSSEATYTQSMTNDTLSINIEDLGSTEISGSGSSDSLGKTASMPFKPPVREAIAQMIHFCQQFTRRHEKDDSAVSLRDVQRCLNLIRWFYKYFPVNPKVGLFELYLVLVILTLSGIVNSMQIFKSNATIPYQICMSMTFVPADFLVEIRTYIMQHDFLVYYTAVNCPHPGVLN
jgi:hypothetical protein